MRILFVSTSYPADTSDPRGIHVHRLASSLVSAGLEVLVVVPAGRTGVSDYSLDGVRVHRVNYWIPRFQSLAQGLSGILPNIKQSPIRVLQVPLMLFALALATRRRAHWADVVHAHWVLPSAVVGVLCKRNRPLVVTSHGGDMAFVSSWAVARWIARWAVRRADRCLGVSEALTADLIRLGASPTACSFQPLGVSVDYVCERVRNLDADKWGMGPAFLHVLFIGGLIDTKQPLVVVEALSEINRRGVNARGAFVGDGPLRAELESRALEADIDVHFAGETAPDQVRAWLQNADVLVLPSRSEGRPVVILEAMASSLPVIASDIPGNRELVEDGESGILVASGSSDDLASALATVASDRSAARGRWESRATRS